MPTATPPGIPHYTGNLFSADVLADGQAAYQQLRDLGDVVWVPELQLYVAARYEDVVLGLRAANVLVSGQGVSVNEDVNGIDAPTGTSTLTCDGARHQALKQLEMRPLLPGSINKLRERIDELANARVAGLIDAGAIEAISQLAAYLPTTIVAELVGIKGLGPDRMLEWSNAIFDAFGPADNQRTGAALPTIAQFVGFGQQLTRQDVIPGSWADQIFDAIDAGKVSLQEGRDLIFDYVIPSLDTTIYATGELLYRLAVDPAAYQLLRKRPELHSPAILEAVRLASPLRGFTRLAVADFRFSQSTIPAGSRSGCSMPRPIWTSAIMPTRRASISNAIRATILDGAMASTSALACTSPSWRWKLSCARWLRRFRAWRLQRHPSGSSTTPRKVSHASRFAFTPPDRHLPTSSLA